jgi:hypothetical protein
MRIVSSLAKKKIGDIVTFLTWSGDSVMGDPWNIFCVGSLTSGDEKVEDLQRRALSTGVVNACWRESRCDSAQVLAGEHARFRLGE